LWKHLTKSFNINNPEYVWSQMLRDKQNSKSSKRQVKQTLVWGHGYEYDDKVLGKVTNFDFYKNIQNNLVNIWRDIPVVGFFGNWDACGKIEVINQWLSAFPQLENNVFQYEDVGHFIEEYKGCEIASKIGELINTKDNNV